jgi:hypothetical protein
MLTYQSIGPTTTDRHLVVYATPGCNVPTVACDCSTVDQADGEAKRLNAEQRTRETVIQCDRTARGLGGAFPGLEGVA